ncbi:MAG TPA: NPCBM/NEW2 domain-containing protein [Lacipirellula sp.]
MPSLLLTALLAFAATASGEVQVATLDGRTEQGAITSWKAGELRLKTEVGEQSLPAAQLMSVKFGGKVDEPADAVHIELADGTRLVYGGFSLQDRKAVVRTPLVERPLQFARDQIRLVELRPSTPLIAAALEEIDSKEVPEDAIVVFQRDSESVDYLTGVIGDVTDEQASFEWDGERVPVKLAKIAAMVFYQAPGDPLPDALCELTLTDGSRIAAREVSLDDERLQVTAVSGVKLQVELARLVSADFSGGKIAYLSDMKPASVEWTPGFGVPASDAIAARNLPRKDASFAGEPLSLNWKSDVVRSRRDVRTYSKGLAIRSRTELTYRLPQGMTRFIATAGIDPRGAAQGSVLLTVRGDDRVLWEGVIDGQKPPVDIDVQLNAARRLHLTVDYGDGLDYGDRLHLVEARVTK